MDILSEKNNVKGWRKFFLEFYYLNIFAWNFIKESVKPPYEIGETLRQFYKIGYLSLPLVSITAFIMGVVLTIQARPTMADFGAVSFIPSMVALSIIKEIGPVITALICAGKIGSGIGAELGSMRVTEQIDAMEVSGINPFKFLVVTRILATILMLPILTIYADAISLLGSYIALNLTDKYSLDLFFNNAFRSIGFSTIFPAIIKTFFFGSAIGICGCYMGYFADKGTESVGKAANTAVVMGSLLVFIIDLIAVQLTTLLTYQP